MIIAFVGKGGVGKTTISSAVALQLSRIGRTAIVSSDFMSSLRHLFPGEHENLAVVELKEKEVAEKWKERYGEEVSVVLDQFVDVDDWIIDHIASSPGVAEEFMIADLVEMELSGKYDYIVWDTAASSSTMHLLMLEREFYEHLDRDVKIYLRFRDRFRSQKVFRLLQEWKDLANRVWKQVRESVFYLVTTSDELSLVQADEITEDLLSMGIEVAGKICNRCRHEAAPDFILAIPELEGSAIEIMNRAGKLLEKEIPNLVHRISPQGRP